MIKTKLLLAIVAMVLVCVFTSCSDKRQGGNAKILRNIVTSDTILSGMISSLLPPSRYSIEAILPPGQCPGHYDMKLSDIEKMKKADLNVSFIGMNFMDKTQLGNKVQIIVDSGGHNWMAPDSYIDGLEILADELSKRFPEDREEIMSRKEDTIRMVKAESNSLIKKIKEAGIFGKPVITSSMQKEVLEWMGFRIVGEYGRQEAMSTKEFVRLSKIGKDQQVIMVVDNFQSGPEVGKGIAETLGVSHIILSNFPSEKGYLATLGENVNAIVSAVVRK
ncbi:MAG: zinc ABC transporter substrate-binding protein [Syntrophaceae bacterium]|nr:zinc ABC transporter substrate-binding protein [Syntrophaceae bacterium]